MIESMSSALSSSLTVSRSPGWLSAWVGSELVMMSAETGLYVSLSETGGRIWDLIEQPRTVDALCDELALEYEVTVDKIRPEVLKFVEEMQEQKALQVQA